jgi:hypothetical protein
MEHAGHSKVPFIYESVPVVDSEHVMLPVVDSDEINQRATEASNNNQVNGHNEQLQVNVQLGYAPSRLLQAVATLNRGEQSIKSITWQTLHASSDSAEVRRLMLSAPSRSAAQGSLSAVDADHCCCESTWWSMIATRSPDVRELDPTIHKQRTWPGNAAFDACQDEGTARLCCCSLLLPVAVQAPCHPC